jgi:hypothetical protein
MKKNNVHILLLCLLLCACGKSFTETDPTTGTTPTPVNQNNKDTCALIGISQINGSITYNNILFGRNASQQTISFEYNEPATPSAISREAFVYRQDSILIENDHWMLRDPQHGQISTYFHLEKINDTIIDRVLYRYKYDAEKRLTQKTIYYNGASLPDFITDYIYNGNLLVRCELWTGDHSKKILVSNIDYDMSVTIKPWIYLFTDAFENNRYLQAFPFGKRSNHPPKQIRTLIYDGITETLLDSWTTNFSGYVYSPDNYVLQTTTTGDNQQGLSILAGTLRFKYQCNP